MELQSIKKKRTGKHASYDRCDHNLCTPTVIPVPLKIKEKEMVLKNDEEKEFSKYRGRVLTYDSNLRYRPQNKGPDQCFGRALGDLGDTNNGQNVNQTDINNHGPVVVSLFPVVLHQTGKVADHLHRQIHCEIILCMNENLSGVHKKVNTLDISGKGAVWGLV